MRRLLLTLLVPATVQAQSMPDMPGMAGMPGMTMAPPPHRPARAAAHHAARHTHPEVPAKTPPTAPIQTAAVAPPVIVRRAADAPITGVSSYFFGRPPVMDRMSWFHGLLDEFEGRLAPGDGAFRWDGEAWAGTDYNKLWVKSEGTLARSRLGDGDQEALYSRSISTYFDVQAGVRTDLDSGPTRTWAALGLQGLALYEFEVQATGYVSTEGRAAARLEGSYDLLITNRLILQPQAELNFYTKSDPARQVGTGLSDVDAGLRLRYEFWRKFAPYVAVTYGGSLGQARRIVREQGDKPGSTRFTLGIRSWF